MWPLVEVQTSAAAWGYFFIAWAVLILGPMLIAAIINAVWWKGHFEKKIMELERDLTNQTSSKQDIYGNKSSKMSSTL